ncbi:MAG: hypothetical protein LBT89_11590 [Planctomycetaceae bacterium]|jgi:tetratricopeptide (TPR) repeat protein|nr:hypothetical protein [Planctomycetaceae bacterium]
MTSGNQPAPAAALDFAEPQTCTECHAEITKKWQKSTHSQSMNHADAHSVRGDFNNVTFLHIGFDDILLLNDTEIKGIIEQTFPVSETEIKAGISLSDLVTALFDAKTGVPERLRKAMSPDQRKEFDAECAYQAALNFQRPADIAEAQDRIVQMLRQLVLSGTITTKLGTRFRMFRENSPNQKETYKVETDIGIVDIAFTIGWHPLQQYLTKREDGRIQTLPIAWDTIQKRWFHVYPKEQILPDDPLHWTKPMQNWNRMCADCHTTNLHKNFKAETLEYKTTFSEINVGCQACHGPCGKHVAAAKSNGFNKSWNGSVSKDVHSLTNITGQENVHSCAFCHARRRLLHKGPKPPETPAADWLVPESPAWMTYYPDGQLLEESFEYGSFIQSKMYQKGVGCSHCHDAHSAELKFQGNRLCTQCHSPSLYDTVRHHFHTDSKKPGTQCVECHFPASKYMVVDQRRDHSIRKPSPALTQAIGVPNACTLCHRDRKRGETLDWANNYVDRWYAKKRQAAVGYNDMMPTPEHYGIALDAARRSDPEALQKLLNVIKDKRNTEFRPIIRASAITLLSRLMEDPAAKLPPAEVLKILADSLTSSDPWERLAAVSALEFQSDDFQRKHLIPFLYDSARAVRTEAARILVRHFSAEQSGSEAVLSAFISAKNEYEAAQKNDNDHAASYLNLAVFQYDLSFQKISEIKQRIAAAPPRERKDVQKSLQPLLEQLTNPSLALYEQSLKIDADCFPVRINLALLYHERGDDEKAEKELREARRINGEIP